MSKDKAATVPALLGGSQCHCGPEPPRPPADCWRWDWRQLPHSSAPSFSSQKVLALPSPSLSWASLTHLKLGWVRGHLHSDILFCPPLAQSHPLELPVFLRVQEAGPLMGDRRIWAVRPEESTIGARERDLIRRKWTDCLWSMKKSSLSRFRLRKEG